MTQFWLWAMVYSNVSSASYLLYYIPNEIYILTISYSKDFFVIAIRNNTNCSQCHVTWLFFIHRCYCFHLICLSPFVWVTWILNGPGCKRVWPCDTMLWTESILIILTGWSSSLSFDPLTHVTHRKVIHLIGICGLTRSGFNSKY